MRADRANFTRKRRRVRKSSGQNERARAVRKYRRHRAKRRDIRHERQRPDAYRRSLQDAHDRAFWADEIYADLSVAQRKRSHPTPKFRMYAVHEARLPAKNPRLYERPLAASRHPNDRARVY